jgi:hypothetical protein
MVINTHLCQSILVGWLQISSGCFTILNCSLQNVLVHIGPYIIADIVSKNTCISL